MRKPLGIIKINFKDLNGIDEVHRYQCLDYKNSDEFISHAEKTVLANIVKPFSYLSQWVFINEDHDAILQEIETRKNDIIRSKTYNNELYNDDIKGDRVLEWQLDKMIKHYTIGNQYEFGFTNNLSARKIDEQENILMALLSGRTSIYDKERDDLIRKIYHLGIAKGRIVYSTSPEDFNRGGVELPILKSVIQSPHLYEDTKRLKFILNRSITSLKMS